MDATSLSLIIPCLNESGIVQERLSALQPMREAGHEVIVVDGGSSDGSRDLAAPLVDKLLVSEPGRARQMHLGARSAKGTILWFIHLDSELPRGGEVQVIRLASSGGWGRFDVRLSGRQRVFRLIERMMNLRSCLTGIATGDQGIFVHRDLYFAVHGFPELPLMEDIALSRRMKRCCRPACVRLAVRTSSRRWESRGILRTMLLMWSLRLAYYLGVSPAILARWYRPCGTPVRGS